MHSSNLDQIPLSSHPSFPPSASSPFSLPPLLFLLLLPCPPISTPPPYTSSPLTPSCPLLPVPLLLPSLLYTHVHVFLLHFHSPSLHLFPSYSSSSPCSPISTLFPSTSSSPLPPLLLLLHLPLSPHFHSPSLTSSPLTLPPPPLSLHFPSLFLHTLSPSR